MSAEEGVKDSGVCPLCSKVVPLNSLNKHVNDCLDIRGGDVNRAIDVNSFNPSTSSILNHLSSQNDIDIDSNTPSQNTLLPPQQRNTHIQTPIPIRPISRNNPYGRIISRSNSPTNNNNNKNPPPTISSDDHLLCTICNISFPLTQVVFLDCSHHFCRTCLHSYVVEMTESNRVSSIACKECRADFSPMDIKEILNQQEYEKYMEASVQEVVDVTGIFLRCPNPKCRNLMERIRESTPRLPKYYPPMTAGGMPISNVPYTNRKTPSPSPSPSPPIIEYNVRSRRSNSNSRPFSVHNSRELGPNGQFLSSEAISHRDDNRFRCRECGTTFCASCGIAPYHVGFTCDTYKRYEASQNCRYCNTTLTPIPKPPVLSRYSLYNPFPFLRLPASLASIPTSMRTLIPIPLSVLAQLSYYNPVPPTSITPPHSPNPIHLHTNSPSTTENSLATKVCNGADCQSKLAISCSKTLECGHFCCGIKGETKCLPCLDPLCVKGFNSDLEEPPSSPSKPSVLLQRPLGVDNCAICWVEVLEVAPCIQLECGHVFHYECVRKKVSNGGSGKRITFGFLDCALCQRRMSHPALEADMKPFLELYETVLDKALSRLKMMGQERCPELTTPGSRWYNNIEGYVMNRFSYFPCFKCKQPYFGGERVCEGEVEPAFNKEDLICGRCTEGNSAVCGIHGDAFIEYKCKFCCRPAVFFCWGSTHFCNKCHDKAGTIPHDPIESLPPCSCNIPHPPNGLQEFCFGCSICRMQN
eukprot:TRINITY_DN626_c0_g1_i2.p1 TRINITY_DN626_c0_g1~~TRINITY_DN626_c0_g1_i2.p1  ORF type:complete len:753 (+),score=87.02 TRINITY_DN626_c0_g1_i2:295-2553(+)